MYEFWLSILLGFGFFLILRWMRHYCTYDAVLNLVLYISNTYTFPMWLYCNFTTNSMRVEFNTCDYSNHWEYKQIQIRLQCWGKIHLTFQISMNLKQNYVFRLKLILCQGFLLSSKLHTYKIEIQHTENFRYIYL